MSTPTTPATEDPGFVRAWFDRLSFYAKTVTLLAVAGIFVILFATVGNGVSDLTASSTPTTSSSSSPSGQRYATNDLEVEMGYEYDTSGNEAYLEYVHANSTNTFQGGDMKLLQLGRSACEAERDGYADVWATGIVQTNIADYSGTAVLQEGATSYLCPAS